MRRLFVLAIVLALLAGCARFGPGSGGPSDPAASDGPSTASPSATPNADGSGSSDEGGADAAEQLVLRLEQVGGFVPVEWLRTNIPSVSVYADGSVITQGPVTMQYPGHALPNLQVSQLSADELEDLLEAAADAGLTQGDRDLPSPIVKIADAGTTVITVVVDGRTHRTGAYALMGMTDESDPARRAMREFIEGELGNLTAGGSEPYRFDAMRVWVSPSAFTIRGGGELHEGGAFDEYGPGDVNPGSDKSPGSRDPLASEATWPLDTPLSRFGEPSDAAPVTEGELRCGVVSGDELETLLEVINADANELTQWRSGGELYSVQFRPLLPDEEGCPASETPAS